MKAVQIGILVALLVCVGLLYKVYRGQQAAPPAPVVAPVAAPATAPAVSAPAAPADGVAPAEPSRSEPKK